MDIPGINSETVSDTRRSYKGKVTINFKSLFNLFLRYGKVYRQNRQKKNFVSPLTDVKLKSSVQSILEIPENSQPNLMVQPMPCIIIIRLNFDYI
ncbi:hypothetical protein J6590_000410 [Homalodisca vitripennis]|nr:hypothetical protein J6590_000410 [Homalodisca vitripennis]